MRVLLSIPAMARGKGGAEKTAANLANELARRGHDVAVICNGDDNSVPSYPLNSSVRFLANGYISGQAHLREQAMAQVRDISADVVVIFYADISILRQLAFFRQTDAAIVVQECTCPSRAVRNLLRGLKQQLSFKTAFLIRQAIFENVEGVRLVMPAYYNSVAPVFRPKTAAFYNHLGNAANPELSDNAKSASSSAKIKKIICVGGLKDINKNGLVAAQAFARIARKHPDWQLHFFGVNRFQKQLKKIQRKYRVKKQIIDRGIVHDMEREYASAQFSLLCSFEEGNPNVVNEAMLFGVPVIGYEDCAGFCGLASDQVDSIIIAREPEEDNLTAAISQLITDEILRKKLARGAIATINARPPGFVYFDNWEKLINRAWENRQHRRRTPAEAGKMEDILRNATRFQLGDAAP